MNMAAKIPLSPMVYSLAWQVAFQIPTYKNFFWWSLFLSDCHYLREEL